MWGSRCYVPVLGDSLKVKKLKDNNRFVLDILRDIKLESPEKQYIFFVASNVSILMATDPAVVDELVSLIPERIDRFNVTRQAYNR